MPKTTFSMPEAMRTAYVETLEAWQAEEKMRRLWERDPSLWTGDGEDRWLGWLDLTEGAGKRAEALTSLTTWIRQQRFSDAVVLGMGGSSLCPEVLSTTFGPVEGFPALHILDSTDPAQIRSLENALDLDRTLFIVSSKSGTTLEPNVFLSYFFDRVGSPDRFLAVTDPGSKLEALAREKKFHAVFHGVPSVGGRYSALSSFGMVPGAAMGLDVADFLGRAHQMAKATAASVPLADNPGATLGIALGVAAREGRDKLTFIISPRLEGLGAWLEQLIAESTGKHGRGIIPVEREPLGGPDVYGTDRLFAYVRLESDPDPSQEAAVTALEASEQAVVRIPVADVRDLGRELFRWEIATAVAGAVLGINPFDQPDVEASKILTRKLTDAYEKTGALPEETPFGEDGGIRMFANDANRIALESSAALEGSLAGVLRAHLERLDAGDYFALLAYVERCAAHEAPLQRIRRAVRDRKQTATCLGFGPRFLHSTGQLYKGGPNTGVFLQITCEDARDLPVPGHPYTFGVVKAAQARGDFQVLAERRRRVLRLHLADVDRGLSTLADAIEKALD